MNNPTLHSHTPTDPQAKTWQRACLSNRTTDRQTEEEIEALGGNITYTQAEV